MARQTELSEAEVFDVITGLVSTGQYPTAARIREQLENRGSPVVLQRFLADWYEQNGPRLASTAEGGVPAPDAPAERKLLERMRAVTEEGLKQVEQELAQREIELEEREAALNGFQSMLDTREIALEGRESAIAQQLQDAAEREARLVGERDQALEAATTATGEAGRSAGALDAAHRIIDRLEAARVDAAALQSKLDLALQESGRHASRVKELVGELSLVRADLVAAAAERDHKAGALYRAQNEADIKAKLLASACKEAKASSDEVKTLHGQVESLKQQLNTAAVRENDAGQRILLLNESIASSKTILEEVRRERNSALQQMQEHKAQAAANQITLEFLKRLIVVDVSALKTATIYPSEVKSSGES